MNKNFWNTLNRPFFASAPMADVTDVAFRTLFSKYGKPDVMWTEFVSADGLFLARENSEWKPLPSHERVQAIAEICYMHGIARNHPLILDLVYFQRERPIVVQFFSPNPELMRRAAQLGVALGFDGIDLNMGCPADVICKQGSGAAMIKTPDLAIDVIRSACEGADDLPVSVKTRAGYNLPDVEGWISTLLQTSLSAITLHARTRKEMSKVPASWEYVSHAVDLKNRINPKITIIGNGDITSREEGMVRVRESGADGIMIGRGIFGNPWVFTFTLPTITERLHALAEHATIWNEFLGNHKSFSLMKKHIKAYINGWEGSKDEREYLMVAEDYDELMARIDLLIIKHAM
jgi:tRNA-dihydrouridine synthase